MTHDPVIKGKGSSCWADCPQCGPKVKVNEGNGAVVGSRQHVQRAVNRHKEKARTPASTPAPRRTSRPVERLYSARRPRPVAEHLGPIRKYLPTPKQCIFVAFLGAFVLGISGAVSGSLVLKIFGLVYFIAALGMTTWLSVQERRG